jgi:hypothetical protein
MTRLVRLYPRAWRDRYEAEFLALLAERRPSARDTLDTVGGAIDAHLHPQLAGPEIEPMPWTHRIPGVLALAGGLLWASVIVALLLGAVPASDLWNPMMWGLMLMFLSLPGDYATAHGPRIAIGLVLTAIAFASAPILGWSILTILAGSCAVLIVLGGMLSLAAIRAGIGPRRRWLLLILTVVIQVAAGVGVSSGLLEITPDERSAGLAVATLVVPYTLAWVLLGLRMAIRGAPTIVDPPLHPIQPEVRPA